MPAKSLFDKPFDEGTLFKLKIFNDYFKEWLPVFISSNKTIWKNIQIFDLFSGMGKDENGVLGSPLLILSELNRWAITIENNKLNVNVILNEFNKNYFEALEHHTQNFSQVNSFKVQLENRDFKDVFDEYYPSMNQTVNFLFLDQNGIKQITENIFKKIIQLQQTDFIFFISSSFIKRFSEADSFQKYLKISKQDLENKSYYHIHRIVLDYYRSLIPSTEKYFIAPFSIKKPSGIYGLIFGTNHIYGLEKFISVCWKNDKITGEANFDIDNEKIDLSKPTLFQEFNVPKKIQVFEKSLKDKILSGVITTDIAVYTFSLEEGFLPRHSNKILEELKANKKIDFSFSLISSRVHKILSPSKIIVK